MGSDARIVPTSRDRHPSKLDPIGAVLSMAGLGLFVYGLIEAPKWGWASPTSLSVIGAGIGVLGLFALWELHSRSPMLDVRLFKDRRFGVSSIGMMLVFLTMFGFFFVVSQLFQLVLGYGPFESGLRMLPIMPVMIIFSTRAAGLVERFGARTIVTIGQRLEPLGSDKLDWDRLAQAQGVYFTAGDVSALEQARRADVLVATPRARHRTAHARSVSIPSAIGFPVGPTQRGSLASSHTRIAGSSRYCRPVRVFMRFASPWGRPLPQIRVRRRRSRPRGRSARSARRRSR